MEEKKPKKISLSTFFLIIAIIVIIVMGFIMYKLYQDKESANNKLQELNVQLDTLENEMNNLQETINTNNNGTNEISNINSTISMDDIYLPQTFKIKSPYATEEATFQYYIEEQKYYIMVTVNNSEIECTVLDNNQKPNNYKSGKTIIQGCNERVVNVAFQYSDAGFVSSIFLLTSSKNVYACNIRYLYDISTESIQANLILKDVISIGTTSGGYAKGWHTVVALKDDGSYAICDDGERDGE